MNKTLLSSIFALAITFAAPQVSAQGCPPGTLLCGGVSVSAGVQFGQAPPPPPPPQQVIVVEQRPVYVAPPPQPVYVTTAPTYAYTTTTVVYPTMPRARGFGLGGFAAGLGFGSRDGDGPRGVGGIGGILRFRQHPRFATELALSGMVGTDYNHDSRVEVPLTLSELFYFNPENRVQFYGVLGIGVSWAVVAYNGANIAERGIDAATYTYFGALAGLGLEWQLSPHFSLYGDARAFIRTRIDDETTVNPEFIRRNRSGERETTNSSVGVLGQIGGLFYF